MKTRPIVLLPILAAFLAPFASAQDEVQTDAQDLPAVLKTIDELEKQLTDGVSANNVRALRALQAAVASPKASLELYLEARKDVEFDQVGKADADWRAWRDQNEEKNKATEHITALQIQYCYLILILQATSVPADQREETIKKMLPLLVALLDDVAEKYPKLGENQSVLNASVIDSPVAKHFKLDITFDRKSGMPGAPADVGGIYEKIILPVYRKARDVRMLQSAWDKRMVQEAGVVKLGGGGGGGGFGDGRFRRGDVRDIERARDKEASRIEDEASEHFREIRLPELQWEKERDGLLYGGDRAAAYSKLTQLLRANLDHPSAKKWLEDLKNLAAGATTTPGEGGPPEN